MLPKKLIDKVSSRAEEILHRQKTPEQQKTFLSENKDKPMVGVLNIKTGEITLYPCVSDRVWIEVDPQSGEVVKAWEQTRDKYGILVKGDEITDVSKIKAYNDSIYAPRVVSVTGQDQKKYFSSHMFLINLMGKVEEKGDYRGFAIVPSKDGPRFLWDSASLNKKSLFGSKVMRQKDQDIVISKMRPLINVPKAANQEKFDTTFSKNDLDQLIKNTGMIQHCYRSSYKYTYSMRKHANDINDLSNYIKAAKVEMEQGNYSKGFKTLVSHLIEKYNKQKSMLEKGGYDLIAMLNRDSSHHQYTRMLGLLLKSIGEKYPEMIPKKIQTELASLKKPDSSTHYPDFEFTSKDKTSTKLLDESEAKQEHGLYMLK